LPAGPRRLPEPREWRFRWPGSPWVARAAADRQDRLLHYAFDLLYLDGADVRAVSLGAIQNYRGVEGLRHRFRATALRSPGQLEIGAQQPEVRELAGGGRAPRR